MSRVRPSERPIVGDQQDEQGGEAACFAQLLCPDCGAVLDGSAHRPDCPRTNELAD